MHSEFHKTPSASQFENPFQFHNMDYKADILDLCIRKQQPQQRCEMGENNNEMKINCGGSPTYLQPDSPNSGGNSECSETNSDNYSYGCIKPKLTRPFKAFPKDPLSLTMGITAEPFLVNDSTIAYTEFRKKMLCQVQSANTGTNKNMRRVTPISPTQVADPTYWEKRRKNNEAAKRSRDARRAKEDEIAIRCAFLEQENVKLKYETMSLRNELERLRKVVYPPYKSSMC